MKEKSIKLGKFRQTRTIAFVSAGESLTDPTGKEITREFKPINVLAICARDRRVRGGPEPKSNNQNAFMGFPVKRVDTTVTPFNIRNWKNGLYIQVEPLRPFKKECFRNPSPLRQRQQIRPQRLNLRLPYEYSHRGAPTLP